MPPRRRTPKPSQTTPLNLPIQKLFRLPPPPTNPLFPELSSPNNLALITYTLSVSPVWLVREFVKRWMLVGEEAKGKEELVKKRGVVIVSFVREPRMWEELEGVREGDEGEKNGSGKAAQSKMGWGTALDGTEQPPLFVQQDYTPRTGPSPTTTSLLLSTRPREPSHSDPPTPISHFTVIDGLAQLFAPQPAPKPLSSELRWSKDNTAEEVKMKTLTQRIASVIQRVKTKFPDVLLVLDGIDFLQSSTALSTSVVVDSIMDLRCMTSNTIITSASDKILLSTSPPNPLATSHARLLTTLIHASHSVFQLRALDTGAARDVSGVLRISRGCNAAEEDSRTWEGCGSASASVGTSVNAKEEFGGEFLYHLLGDGAVRVFERGE